MTYWLLCTFKWWHKSFNVRRNFCHIPPAELQLFSENRPRCTYAALADSSSAACLETVCTFVLAVTCTSPFSSCFSRPAERSGEDVDIILARLKNVKAFERFHPSLLQRICLCGFYECLERGITCKSNRRVWNCHTAQPSITQKSIRCGKHK